MGEEDYYLELCERPVQFEKANPVNCVFFDEANKQVFAVRSGGATGVVVKGPDDRNPISFRIFVISSLITLSWNTHRSARLRTPTF
uniref:Regulator of MON1-CCZ1 complex N-terminal domain-containing protein n=1 Tax=Propithecus coquereli TaxID=379532 RepID=A0A2K6GTP7_PROCO